MKRFYVHAFGAFALWLLVSLAFHFYSPDPWGGAVTHASAAQGEVLLAPASATELFVRSIILELGLLLVVCLGLAWVDRRLSAPGPRAGWRVFSVALLTLHGLYGHIDREVLRWMGEHMTVSFIRTYTNVAAIGVTGDVLSGDAFWSRVMLIVAVLLATPLIYTLFRLKDNVPVPWSRRAIALITLSGLLMASVQYVAPVKRRKLYRIDPGIVRLTRAALWDALKLGHPKDAETARADLIAISRGYAHHDIAPAFSLSHPSYPLWRNDNVGSKSIDDFNALPLDEKPDILLIIVETWRGWQTGLDVDPLFVGNPKLKKIFEDDGAIFPYTHSAGFPSTEGILGVHLSLWSDPEKVFIIDHLSIRSRGLTNVLSDAGYQTYALLGFDPSFDNLTPALTRWYDEIEHNAAYTDDAALFDHLHTRYAARDRSVPHFMALTTRTTHAPYMMPDNTGVTPASDSEERYRQTVRYSDEQLARFIESIRETPDWDRTLIFIVGDHAQPTPYQRNHQDIYGRFTPGNTWTALGITGGWTHGISDGRYDFTTSLVDIAPTLLSLLDIQAYNHFLGRDLVRATTAWNGSDPAARERVAQWPVLSANRGHVMWEQGDRRSYFSMRNTWRIQIDFDRQNPFEYGQLEDLGGNLSSTVDEAWTVDRWADALRAYRYILDHDQLMPPEDKTSAP